MVYKWSALWSEFKEYKYGINFDDNGCEENYSVLIEIN